MSGRRGSLFLPAVCSTAEILFGGIDPRPNSPVGHNAPEAEYYYTAAFFEGGITGPTLSTIRLLLMQKSPGVRLR